MVRNRKAIKPKRHRSLTLSILGSAFAAASIIIIGGTALISVNNQQAVTTVSKILKDKAVQKHGVKSIFEALHRHDKNKTMTKDLLLNAYDGLSLIPDNMIGYQIRHLDPDKYDLSFKIKTAIRYAQARPWIKRDTEIANDTVRGHIFRQCAVLRLRALWLRHVEGHNTYGQGIREAASKACLPVLDGKRVKALSKSVEMFKRWKAKNPALLFPNQ